VICPDCEVDMVEGFLPDNAHLANLQIYWHPGPAKQTKFLGMDNGVKVQGRRTIPVSAFRCAQCGLIRLYGLGRSQANRDVT